MANDWIKIRKELPTDPNVASIAAGCGISIGETILALIIFWSWADSHSVDGRDLTVSTAFIDDMVRVRKFSASLADTNWLEVSDDTVSIPRFEVHLGSSAKRRATDSKRKSSHRNDVPNRRPQNVRKMSALHEDKMRTREEKRREEMSTSLTRQIYEAYPRHIGKAKAIPAIDKAIEAIVERGGWMKKEASTWLLYRVQRFADSPAGKAGKFTPYPTTWFNGGRYDDDDAEWQGADGDSGNARDAEFEKKRVAEIEQRTRARREQNAKDMQNSAPEALTKLASRVLNRKD